MSSKKSRSFFLKVPFITICVLILAAVAFVIVYNNTSLFKKSSIPITESSDTKGVVANNSQPKSNNSTVQNSSNATTSSSPTSKQTGGSAVLLTPSGDFVSDHHPNLSGSPAPNTMSSVCNTTPGATCELTFTMGSTVKSLPSQVADAGGATYWNWKLQDYGLTAGSWTIQAIATLNGQSKTADDALALVVSQ